MCKLNYNNECPVYDKCYLYISEPSYMQSYSYLFDIDDDTGFCKNFIPDETKF